MYVYALQLVDITLRMYNPRIGAAYNQITVDCSSRKGRPVSLHRRETENVCHRAREVSVVLCCIFYFDCQYFSGESRASLVPPLSPFFFIFMHFCANIMPNNRLVPLLWGWRPPLGNPGSVTSNNVTIICYRCSENISV